MKIPFPLPIDNLRHRYCQNCFSEEVNDILIKEKRLYKCNKCGKTFDRLIDIDPKLVYWVDKDTKEYWHESVGVFVSNQHNQILLIERTIYPYGHTVPSGHLETGEIPQKAAIRELYEETGIETSTLDHFKDENITIDPCRRGADAHHWHVYKYKLSKETEIITNVQEGKNAQWFSLQEALSKTLTPPVALLLQNYGNKLTN